MKDISEKGLKNNIRRMAFIEDYRGVLLSDMYGFFLSDMDNGGTKYYLRKGDRLRIPVQNYGRPGFRVYNFRVCLGLPSRSATQT